MSHSENIAVRGHLTITKVVEHGDDLEELETLFEGFNLITNVGLSYLPWMLANNLSALPGVVRSSDLTVQRMEIGNSVTIPAITDTTGVSSFLYAPPVEVVTTPGTPPTMSFGGYLPPAEGNDPAAPGTSWFIREEALILGNGVVFAKKCFSVPKNNTFGLYFRHRISFARA